MFRVIKNKNGNTVIVTMAILLILAAAGLAVVNLSSTGTKEYTDNMQAAQALAVGNAGLQWALDKVNNGQSPVVSNKTFADGKFSIATDPNASLITSTAIVGDTRKVQSINADFARNCMDLIVSQGYIEGDTLKDVRLIKSCNKQSILDTVTLSWDGSECAVNVNCDGSVSVDDEAEDEEEQIVYEDVGEAPKGKFWICHVPPGNPENAHSIAVNMNGWIHGHDAGHNQHNMDYLGPCIISQGDDDDEGEGEDEGSLVTCLGTNQSTEALAACEAEDQGTLVQVSAGDTVVFSSGSVPAADSVATATGIETNVEDTIMTENSVYSFDFKFSKTIPSGSWFTITAKFADGSSLTGLLKAGDQPSPVQEETSEDSDSEDSQTPSSPVGFTVENGVVTVEPYYKVDLNVLGAAITCGASGPSVNVRAQLCINNDCSNLWGYTDVNGGETYSVTNSANPSQYKIRGNAYLASCNNFNRTYDSTNTVQVKTLRNGEQAPALAGFGGQMSVQEFLRNYLDAQGRMVLADNQVIMLFELGIDLIANPGSTATDFQDLVVLMTVSEVIQE